ncbi:hypothetical protein CC80DRAFT_495861 [Byssothecium circinans]|uniref:N-acetyltransferase domain-containing protein n=1 Tax=Byssothecium circinans TaxID=147558 RepID=A0A6A5TGI4_9PLEO|nr:hypothetical protein CC80DRAFT_495861 [Byssothecium circinans]
MAEYKATFIKVPITTPGYEQTQPVEPSARLPDSEIRVELCVEDDVDYIAEGLYRSFPESFWTKMDPPSIREPNQTLRQARLASRLRPTFHDSKLKWIKAIYTPTQQVVGIAGWMAPGNPIFNPLRHDAIDFYPWRTTLSLTDAAWQEMWKGCSIETWDGQLGRDDVIRAEVMGDEPHWHLAPLLTWPEFQGKGVGGKLLKWAIEQADATDPVTPMYLESAVTARAVYIHKGFVPQGAVNMVRRGPRVLTEEEYGTGDGTREEPEERKVEKVDVEVVASQVEGGLAS